MKRVIGELEIAILNIIRSKKRVNVQEVYEQLGRERKYTTVMTVMHRLYEKNELCREKVGRRYEYWIEETKRVNRGLLSRLKEKIFGGKSIEMIAYLLEMDDEISDEEIKELELLIEKRKKQ